jgi:hypothetical protein
MQYARLSKRARRAYDKKRHAEWEASAEGRDEWAAEVIAAFNRGEFTLEDPQLHPEAAKEIRHAQYRAEEAEKEKAAEEARKSNQITGPEDVSVGDRVYSVFAGYGTIVRVSKLSVRVDFGSREMRQRYGALQRLSPDDLKKECQKSDG